MSFLLSLIYRSDLLTNNYYFEEVMSLIINNEKISELLNYFWNNASNKKKRKVKDIGDYSYYDTIRSALERGRFSERMIKSFMKVMNNEELNKIIKNEYNDMNN